MDETPAATSPGTGSAPSAELSLDDIVAQAVSAAESTGTPVVEPEAKPADAPANTEATPGPEVSGDPAAEPASEEPKADEITTARARKILEAAEDLQAKLDARGRELDAREGGGAAALVAELLKSPKAFLAKHGKNIDELIDASVAEGKVEAPQADDRVTALERRLAQREQEEQRARDQAAIDAEVSRIHREVKGNAKLVALNAADAASQVTDYMIEYHRTHGKAIAHDRAAFLVEQDLKRTAEKVAKALGWTPPAAPAPKPAAPAPRPGTPSIGGEQTASATQSAEVMPDDPDALLSHLVAKATREAAAKAAS